MEEKEKVERDLALRVYLSIVFALGFLVIITQYVKGMGWG